MDFKQFKKNRSKLATNIATKLKDKKPSYVDDRFWNVTKDAQGNAEAVIRFLPTQDMEKEPIALKFAHGFKENNKWFFVDCPSTNNDPCPACEFALPFWDDGSEAAKTKAFKYSRKKQYICNIQVVRDLSNPKNDGQVFLFKFGVNIFEKIMNKIAPESELDTPVNVFDLWEGVNFKLKVKKKGGYPNYDDSEFYGEKTPVGKTDEEIEKVYNQIKELDEFTDKTKFQSYDSIKKKLIGVLGAALVNKQLGGTSVTPDVEDDTQVEDNMDTTASQKNVENDMKVDENVDDDSSDDITFDDSKDDENDDEDDFNFDDDEDDFNFIDDEDDMPF